MEMSAGSEQKQTSERQVLPSAVLCGSGFLYMLVIAVIIDTAVIFFVAGVYVGKYVWVEKTSPAVEVKQEEEEPKSEVENALENDAQFKKIHDFLLREYPVEFKVPELPKKNE
ncbi:MAG: hypothetical protein FWE67_02935 [Planctomycetaceae bacterium]|nr:hypothetical protein [Planctomycetaceae bacterium]